MRKPVEPIGRLLVGKRIRLTQILPDDIAVIQGWCNDTVFMRLFDSAPAMPRTAVQVRSWFEKQDEYSFAIRLLDGDAMIGLVGLDEIEWSNSTCGIGYGIGEASNRGRGYGTEAVQLALEFAFSELNMHRVTATVFSYNPPSARLLEKLGFVHEGIMRERVQRDGRRHDLVFYGLLRPEWERQTAAQSPDPGEC